jgi:multisubunit Na+/H+ antiporter MnhC subunit
MSDDGAVESEEEYTQDIVLGLSFLIIALFSGWRTFLYFSLSGGGKVVTVFYLLITATAVIRTIWFLIPSSVLEGNYSPVPTLAFESPRWKGVLVSEVMLGSGSLCLYAVLLLVVCYWAHMLQKVEHPESPDTNYLIYSQQRGGGSYNRQFKQRRGPMSTFAWTMFGLVGAQALNIILFLCRVYNSEVLILYDSILFSFTSLSIIVAITIFSNKIRVVLTTIGVINENSTKPQVRRILAITVAANIFFVTRLVIELSITALLLTLWIGVCYSHFYC